MTVETCLLKHLGAKSPINAYRADMAADVAELVADGMTSEAAWIQVVDAKLTDLKAERTRIEQVVADAYAKTAAGKPAEPAAPVEAAAAQPAVATHKDPGEPAESVTPAVVAEAIKTAVAKTDRKPSEMKAELLSKVDEAIKEAPDYRDFQTAVASMGEKDAIASFTTDSKRGALGEKYAPTTEGKRQRTFKIEGDGTFTVNNTVRQLLKFRQQIATNKGFTASKSVPAPERATDTLDRRSAGAAITNMIDDGDAQAAVDFAAARGVNIREVLSGDKVRLPKIAGLTPTTDEGPAGEFEPEPAPEPDAPTAQIEQTATESAQETPAEAGPANAAKPGIVDNFGEALPPSRRQQRSALDKELSDDDISAKPLSEIWPLAENDAIEDKFAAAVAHAARAEVPAKPRRGYKLQRWVESVKVVRDLAQKIVSGGWTREELKAKAPKSYAMEGFWAKVALLEAIDRAQWKRIGTVREYPQSFEYGEGGKRIPKPQVSVTIDDKHHQMEGSGSVADHIDAINMLLGVAPREKRMEFEVRGSGSRFAINKKGDSEYRPLKVFTTSAEALEYKRNKYADLLAAWEDVKKRDNVTEADTRGEVNEDRVGPDHRNGRDITGDEFDEAFGFKGGEFGKWVSQGKGARERQWMLNRAYDALMDLSGIIGIPPRAISLNGTLGMAFGSRGSGKASAHFEPGNLVINLTKTNGAGALAHEWFHALDNYFARRRGGEVPMSRVKTADGYRKANFVTYRPEPLMVRKDGRSAPMTATRLAELRRANPTAGYLAADQWQQDPAHKEGVRPEVEERFADLVKALDEAPMTKRASTIDKGKSEGYWSQIIERAARSFEAYVIERLREKGQSNQYLANVTPLDKFVRDKGRYPYPTPDEIKPVADAFDALFGTVQTRTDDAGNVEMFSLADEAGSDIAAAWKTLADNDDLFAFPKSDAADLAEIASEAAPNLSVEPATGRLPDDVQAAWHVYPPNKPKTQDNRGYVIHYKDGKVEVNVAKFQQGDAGSQVYAVAGNYAFNNGLEFAGDRLGITDVAVQRRLENMISLALKFGTTDFMSPHPDMLKTLGLKWTQGDSNANLQNMLLASYENAISKYPALKDVVYDPSTGKLQSQSRGVALTDAEAARLVAGARVRGLPIGRRTLSRLSVTQAVAESQAGPERGQLLALIGERARGPVESLGVLSGVAYSPSDGVANDYVPADTAAYGTVSQADRFSVKKLEAALGAARSGLVLDPRPAVDGAQAGQPLRGLDRTRVAAAELAQRLFDKQVTYFTSSEPFANGLVSSKQPNRVFVLHGASRPHMAILGHELLHSLRIDRPDLYAKLADRIMAVTNDRSDADMGLQLKRLKAGLPTLDDNLLEEEFVADVVGDRFTEPEFWQLMAKDQPAGFKAVIQAVLKFIDDTLSKIADIRPFGTEVYLKDIQAAREAVAESLRNYSAGEVGAMAGQGETISLSIAGSVAEPNGDYASQVRTAQDLIDARGSGVFDFNRIGATKQDRIRTVVDGSRPFWLGALTRDQIADIYGSEIQSVKEYDALTRAMENERSKMAGDADTLYGEWAKIDQKDNDRLARIMLDATVHQVHPDGPFVPGGENDTERKRVHGMISTQFRLLPPEAKAMYGKVKGFHLDTLTKLRDALMARIERQVDGGQARAAALTNIRQMFDKYLGSGPYFPLSRFGDYLVVATREEDGERVVASYETAGEQQAAARKLESDGFRVKMKTAKTYSRETDGAAGKFIGDVLTLVDGLDMDDASVGGRAADLKNKLLDDINQLFIKALPDLSYRKHFMHRKGTAGFSSDVMRGFASSAFHAASHIARLNHGDKMTFALQDAFSAIENAPAGDFNQHSQVLNELTKRHDAALNPNTHPIAAMLNQIGFVMYLGLSPAAGIVNMLQTVMVTMPHLGARYGFGKANGSLATAYKDILAAPVNAKSGWNAAQSQKLSASERAVMTELQDEGVIDLTQAHDLASATGMDTGNVARSKAAFAMSRAMKIVGWTFHIPEVMNRQVTALSAYRLEMEKSGDVEAAKDAAREAIKRTHFDYSGSNRARFMQSNPARVMLQFKQYSQNMTYLLGRAAFQALKGESPEVRAIARKQLVATLGVTFGMAGALGLPGIGGAMGLIGALVQGLDDDDKPWDWQVEFRNLLADTVGQEAGEVIAHGIPRALMPWDISSRVGLGDMWFRSNDREGQNPREAWANDMQNILGPSAGTLLGMYTAADHMARGNWSKGVESMVPKFLRDPLKAMREGNEGMTNYNGEPLLDVGGLEVMGRALGFAPARGSEMFEARNAVKNAETAINMKRQRLLSTMVKARLDLDSAAIMEIQADIMDFNRRNPAFRITSESIVKSTQAKRRNMAATKAGIRLPKGKDELRELGRFAEVE